MNVLVTIDSNYVRPLCVMLRSLTQSNPCTAFDVYVANSDLTDADFHTIGKCLEGSSSRVIGIRVPDSLFADAPVLKRISKATYYRLFAPMYLPKEVDRILYLDPDTLILNDLSALYHLELGDYFYAGCGHLNSFMNWLNTARLGMSARGTYVNAGVLLMNIRALRAFFSANDVFDYVQKHAAGLFLADQDVLNALYADRILPLDSHLYNLDERCFHRLSNALGQEGAFNFVRTQTCIVHYDGKYKPWNPDYHGELDCLYPIAARKQAVRIFVK